MSFDEEWAQLKQAAHDRLRRTEETAPGHRLHLAGHDPGRGYPTRPDLSLDDAPIRVKANDLRTVTSDGRKNAKLADAAAAGTSHASWLAGAASDDCVTAWQGRLKELSDLVEDGADSLNKAMDMHISGDESVAAELVAAARWLDRA
ncbi:hypothetical protein WDH52_10820 [Streptomyces sp. TRM70308]|uniref:hypothetical protein n=1 Tax=Streptomyces sp. TRM70308 TaxID=3131932 RepID=UPI003CFE0F2D